ncbi:MAG: glutamate 5-kinase [Campylobacterota bacterium]
MRLVLKVGSAVLTKQNQIAKERMRNLVSLIAQLKTAGHEVMLVSSGAVAAGYTRCRLDKTKLVNKQALAAIGQPFLLSMYQKKLQAHQLLSAQVLLSADDFDSRKRTNHAKQAVDRLLEEGVVPIINENDATATEELVFGDNDRLSAHAAYYFKADLLVILSDIEGYFDKNPKTDPGARLRPVVDQIESSHLQVCIEPGSHFATGGIVTKLQAADFLLQRGKRMFLASGFDLSDAESFLLEGRHRGGTLFEGPR